MGQAKEGYSFKDMHGSGGHHMAGRVGHVAGHGVSEHAARTAEPDGDEQIQDATFAPGDAAAVETSNGTYAPPAGEGVAVGTNFKPPKSGTNYPTRPYSPMEDIKSGKRAMTQGEASRQIDLSNTPSARSENNRRMAEAGVDTTRVDGDAGPSGPQNLADIANDVGGLVKGAGHLLASGVRGAAHAIGLGQKRTENDESIDLNNTPTAQSEARRRATESHYR